MFDSSSLVRHGLAFCLHIIKIWSNDVANVGIHLVCFINNFYKQRFFDLGPYLEGVRRVRRTHQYLKFGALHPSWVQIVQWMGIKTVQKSNNSGQKP